MCGKTLLVWRWSVARCGQYFGGYPGALLTQLFSARCVSCFGIRDKVFWRWKWSGVSVSVVNRSIFLGISWCTAHTTILCHLQRCHSYFGIVVIYLWWWKMITYRIFSDKNARLSEEHPSSSGWGGRGHCAGGSLSSKKGLVCLQISWNGLFLHCVLSRKPCKQVTPQLIQKQVMGFSGSRRNCLKLVCANTRFYQ